MAAEVIMPKPGNTVESCILLEWKKEEGEDVKKGDPLCDIETDKVIFEIEAESDGVFLKKFYEKGDDVPVLSTIAVIGEKGEKTDHIKPPESVKTEQKNISLDPELMGPFEKLPVIGIRKRISDHMYKSMQQTAQLTLNTSADAEALLELRNRLKESPKDKGLTSITINDLLLFCVAKTLLRFKELNAHFDGSNIYRFENIHLATAVDTKKGLIVPVIRNADKLTIKEISKEARMFMMDCVGGMANPDDLKGSTFTVTNLGAGGIESFTPIINLPEVAILGICKIQLKPVSIDGNVVFRNHIGLSLTINHQVVDGAPASKFLKELGNMIANVESGIEINF